MIPGILAMLAHTAEVLIDKHILSREHVPYKLFVPISFLTIFGIMLLLSPFLLTFEASYFTAQNITLMAALITFAIIGNYLFFYGFEKESINDTEPFIAIAPLFSVILAAAFFPDERNPAVLALAIVACIALIATKVEKHHLVMDKYTTAVFIGMVLFAVQSILAKLLLETWNPFSIYFVRVGISGLILLSFVRIKNKNLTPHKLGWFIISSLAVIVHFVGFYWSIKQIGIVLTTVLLTIAPLLILWGSQVLMKEKLVAKNVAATAVIVLCVIGSILI